MSTSVNPIHMPLPPRIEDERERSRCIEFIARAMVVEFDALERKAVGSVADMRELFNDLRSTIDRRPPDVWRQMVQAEQADLRRGRRSRTIERSHQYANPTDVDSIRRAGL